MILETQFLPLVTLNSLEEAEFVQKCLSQTSFNTVEVALRTTSSFDIFRSFAQCELFFTGAGTVLTAIQAEQVISGGARFVVSPGLSVEVARVCAESDVPYIPGVATPSDIQNALEIGLNYLKLFPASHLGGLKYIETLMPVFPHVKFMPSGGVSEKNISEYLAQKNVFAASGSWLFSQETLKNFDEAEFLRKAKLLETLLG